MSHAHTTPPASTETLRTDLADILDDITAAHGPQAPMARVLAGALLRGDDKAQKAAWTLYHQTPAKDER